MCWLFFPAVFGGSEESFSNYLIQKDLCGSPWLRHLNGVDDIIGGACA